MGRLKTANRRVTSYMAYVSKNMDCKIRCKIWHPIMFLDTSLQKCQIKSRVSSIRSNLIRPYRYFTK